MFNKNFFVINKTNFNHSNFEYNKTYNIGLLSSFSTANYISKRILYMLTNKRQQFFFYTENDQLFSAYMYNFDLYNHLFVYGDWYAGYLTNYNNVRQNLLTSRAFSNLLFVKKNFSNFNLSQPKAYIFLDQPKDKSALNEFKNVKNLYFENPTVSVYQNSYLLLTKDIFYFCFNLYFLLFQLKQIRASKTIRLYKKIKTINLTKKLLFQIKIVRTKAFFYDV